MSTAGLPTFKKLWGKIKHDLPKGEYAVTIQNNYDVSDFDGEKAIIISTTSVLGGKMSFLGILSLIVGGVSFIGGSAVVGLGCYLKKIRGISID